MTNPVIIGTKGVANNKNPVKNTGAQSTKNSTKLSNFFLFPGFCTHSKRAKTVFARTNLVKKDPILSRKLLTGAVAFSKAPPDLLSSSFSSKSSSSFSLSAFSCAILSFSAASRSASCLVSNKPKIP